MYLSFLEIRTPHPRAPAALEGWSRLNVVIIPPKTLSEAVTDSGRFGKIGILRRYGDDRGLKNILDFVISKFLGDDNMQQRGTGLSSAFNTLHARRRCHYHGLVTCPILEE